MSNKIFYKSLNITNLETDYKGDILSVDIEPLGVIHEKDIKTIPYTTYTQVPYEKYFLMPGTAVPRVKLQNLSVNAGIKIVRSPEDADKVFVGKNSFSKMSKSGHVYAIEKSLVEAYVNSNNLTTDSYIIDRLKIALLNVEHTYIAMDYSARNFFSGNTVNNQQALLRNLHDKSPNRLGSSNFSYEHYLIESTYCEMLDKALNSSTLQICNEQDLLENLNGDDALIISQNEFNQLSEMFKSSDRDNHVLAMEIMANSNYSQSIFYLLRLFKDFNEQMASQKSRTHVNFKSLVSYLSIGSATYNWNLAANKMLEIIKDKSLLTLQMIEETFVAYEYEIKNYSTQDSSVIQIKSFTLHPDYAAFLNTNYVNTIKEDFIPLETVEVPEEPQVLADVVTDKTESISWN
jgi:hypothetical protein